MKLTYITGNESSPISYYRQILPATLLRQYGSGLKIKVFNSGSGFNELENCLDTDIIIFQGLSDSRWINLAREMKKEGKKIVVDYDDNIFAVNPLSPHYEDFGTKEYHWEFPDGKVEAIWEDGKNIDLKKNAENLDRVRESCRLADLITVTTSVLGEVYQPYCEKIAVLPNCLDLTLWKRLPLIPHKEIRIGWFGGHSHYHDWALLKNVVPTIAKKYRNVKFVIMGQVFWDAMQKVSPEQLESHPWVHHMAYPLKAAILDLDIALIPLANDDFNVCKSPIKMLEMGALHIPSVVSHVSPYKDIADEGHNNAFYIDQNDEDTWNVGLSMAIENADLRKQVGQEAYRTVIRDFDITTQWQRWQKAYKELL